MNNQATRAPLSTDSRTFETAETTAPKNLLKKVIATSEDFHTGLQNKNGSLIKNNQLNELVNSCLIDLSEKLDPPPIAMQIVSEGNPITLFTKGNFSIITGAAKSRKTFLVSMLIAAVIKGNFHDLFICNQGGTTIIFDTEQSKYKVQQIAKRICNLCENSKPSNLLIYSLRTLDPSQRIAVIDHVLATTPNITFAAIDGIVDLDVDPILQADQAQRIVLKLMQWTENLGIHITCVLHYNKTISTLLGHLGSFSHRKADAIIEVTKSKEDENISIVSPVDCREKEFKPFAFSIDQSGMPYIMEDYVIEYKAKTKNVPVAKDKKPSLLPTDFDKETHKEILNSVFKNIDSWSYTDCWANIKLNAIRITKEKIGDNKAKAFLTYYLSEGNILKIERKPNAIYVLPGQANLDFKQPV
ncbi:MAG: AAA family ATPase [Ginsengibacter sp.]